MAAMDPSLVMVQMTLSQLILMLSWENETPTSCIVTLQQRNKFAELSGKKGEWWIIFMPPPPFEVMD
jgi:hypothetical protein